MSQEKILSRLNAYKRKYYFNAFLRGLLCWCCVVGVCVFAVPTLEHRFRFDSWVRGGLYFGLLFTFVGLGISWMIIPLYKWLGVPQSLSHRQAAKSIGDGLPEVADKLTNWIELREIPEKHKGPLLKASLAQRGSFLEKIRFARAVRLGENKKYLWLLTPFLLLAATVWSLFPEVMTHASERIIWHQRKYEPPPPFIFSIENESLEGFAYEPFHLSVTVRGSTLPEEVYIATEQKKHRLKKMSTTQFRYTLHPQAKDVPFRLIGNTETSPEYRLKVREKPAVQRAALRLRYPAHTRQQEETLNELKNLFVPEGTYVTWRLNTQATEEVFFDFISSSKSYAAKRQADDFFSLKKRFLNSDTYAIRLGAQENADAPLLRYGVSVVKDEYPNLSLEVFADSLLYDFVVLAGKAVDDYGITQLQIKYTRTHSEDPAKEQAVSIPLAHRGAPVQPFYFKWALSAEEGEVVTYCLEAWDNDSVNGSKSTRSAWHSFRVPTQEAVKEAMAEDAKKLTGKVVKSLSQTGLLRERLRKTDEALKLKKEVDWGDKKNIQKLIKEHLDRNKELQSLQRAHGMLSEQIEKFGGQQDRYKEKMAAMQKIFDELLDEETKALYDELHRLMQERAHLNEVQRTLKKITQEEDFLEKEIERSLALFKHLQFELLVNESLSALEALAKRQQQALRESRSPLGAQKEAQKRLQEDFHPVKDTLNKIRSLNEELPNPYDLGGLKEGIKNAERNQQSALDSLNSGKMKSAKRAQKAAEDALKKLQKKLERVREQINTETASVHAGEVRTILSYLIDLSFWQEEIIKEYKKDASSGHGSEVGRKQFEMISAAEGPLDALYALSKKMLEVQPVITREGHRASEALASAVNALKRRDRRAALLAQKKAMTGLNELGVLLSHLLEQAQSGGGQGAGKMPSLSELQKQLGEQINRLKQSKEGGGAQAKELAEAIARQEIVRKRLQEMMKSGGMMGGDIRRKARQLMKEMGAMEKALADEQVDRQLMERQQRIEQHLWEVENALRQEGTKEERESERPDSYEDLLPPSFEQYKKMKEKELEIYRYAPIKMLPHYEKESDEYFRRMETGS